MVALRQIENTHLWYFDRRTGNTRRLTSGENRSDGVSGLTFAPDGEIVFTARNKNEQNIFSMALDGGPVRQLTRNLGPRNVTPDISPDNQKIVFVSKQTGASRIWIMNRDGSEPKQLTPPSDDHSIEQNAPKFTPDGKWVYFWTFQIGRVAICKISAAGGEPLLVSKAREFVASPAISPDGRWMSFFSHDDQAKPPWRVGIRSLTGDEERYFTIPAGRQLTGWMPDSQTIVSINFQDGNLWQTNVETGTRDRITNFQDERIDNFDVSEDGRYFLLARGNAYWDAVLIEK
jgi:TolB protein